MDVVIGDLGEIYRSKPRINLSEMRSAKLFLKERAPQPSKEQRAIECLDQQFSRSL
jgi:hypothetical protein